MDELAPTDRSRLRRRPDRGRHDLTAIFEILDEGLVCHVGFAHDGRPWVFPTAYGRVGDRLYLHGAAANLAMRSLSGGGEACVTVTLLDGLVLARSAFHHSVNYRSVMLFGTGQAVDDPDEKLAGLNAIVDHLVPGRTTDCRPPTPTELRSTLLVRFPIAEGSAKVRTGGPLEDLADLALPHWAGELPLRLAASEPVPHSDEDAPAAPPAPGYVVDWVRARP